MRTATLATFLAAIAWAAETQLGQPLTLKQQNPIREILAAPDRYVGKKVQVKGKIVEVCEKMGCWTNLVDEEGRRIRVKVRDGDIVFPVKSLGKITVAEGLLEKLDLNLDQARAYAKHEAEEQGRAFRPETITSGTTIYQIAGTGAVIVD